MSRFLLLLLSVLSCIAGNAQFPKPDPSFGGDGTIVQVSNEFSLLRENGDQVFLQSNDKALVLFTTENGHVFGRHLGNGEVDEGFGFKGFTPALGFFPSDATLLPDGSFISAGAVNGNFVFAKFLSNGFLDPSFGKAGILSLDLGGDEATGSIHATKDGKVLVVGTSNTNGANRFVMLRFGANGQLDNTLDGDGKLISDIEITGTMHALVQPDNKVLVSGGMKQGSDILYGIGRMNSDGSVDQTFGTGGVFTGLDDNITDMVLENDGDIIVLQGQQLLRIKKNGTLDLTFGSNGYQPTHYFIYYPQKIGLQSDGKIIVGGIEGSAILSALARHNPDGSPDWTFADYGNEQFSGLAVIGGHRSRRLNSLVIQPDDKIIVAGTAILTGGGDRKYFLARFDKQGMRDRAYTSDASPDDSNESFVSTFKYSKERFDQMLVQPDGKVLATVKYESRFEYPPFHNALYRYNQDGTLDQGFVEQVKNIIPQEYSTYFLIGLAPNSDIIVSHASQLFAFNKDGSLKGSFGNSGVVNTALRITALKVLQNGKVLIAGTMPESGILHLARYNSNGSLDKSFGVNGVQKLDLLHLGSDNFEAKPTVLAIGTDGKIVVSGLLSFNEGALAKYNSNGTPDFSFGDKGKLVYNRGMLQTQGINDVVFLQDGKLLVVGATKVSDIDHFGVARLNKNGSLDKTFGKEGAQLISIGNNATPVSISVQQDGKIIVVGNVSNPESAPRWNDDTDMVMIRLLKNGWMDEGFATKGKLVIDFGYTTDQASKAVVEKNKVFIAGGSSLRPTMAGVLAVYLLDEGRQSIVMDTKARIIMPSVSMAMSAYPNPSRDDFQILIKGEENETLTLRITDLSGRIVYHKTGLVSNSTLSFGKELNKGVYLAEVRQGNKIVVIKLVKQ